jgi:hypothetical protein
MVDANEILNVIAGRIDAPALWRYQFWIDSTFGCSAVAMLESGAKGSAAYLWVLPAAKPNDVSVKGNPSLLSLDSFDRQLACDVPESISNYWQNWRFARVGEVDEGDPYRICDGVRMSMRVFDGSTSHRADFLSPVKELQPLRWQAFNEVFDMLNHLFGWNSILAQSYEDQRKIR